MIGKLEGNPDIVFWNGFVSDWMDITPELTPVRLTKQTLAHYIESCRLERCRDLNERGYQHTEDELKQLRTYYRSIQWEVNDFITIEDLTSKKYTSKTVMMLQAKGRGINTFDRTGNISY